MHLLMGICAVWADGEPGAGGAFARASVCRASACGLVERFGSCDDAVIVEPADLERRQSEDAGEDFVGVFAKRRCRPRGYRGQIAQCDR